PRPTCAATPFVGTPTRQRRRTSLTSGMVTSRYIHASWLRAQPRTETAIARSGEGGKVLKNSPPQGGKGFEKPQSNGGKGFEKVVRKGSLGFENRQERSAIRGASVVCVAVGYPKQLALAREPRGNTTKSQ